MRHWWRALVNLVRYRRLTMCAHQTSFMHRVRYFQEPGAPPPPPGERWLICATCGVVLLRIPATTSEAQWQDPSEEERP